MSRIHIQYQKTKIGEMIMGSFNNRLCLLDFRYRKMRSRIDKRVKKGLMADYVEKDDILLSEARMQLDEYLNGNRAVFTIPLQMVGSDFQKKVWRSLLKVPYGDTSTYLQIAKDINNEKAVRAVANANGANCIGVIIPCHRIIGSNGELVGYAGGIPVKKKLLNLEKQHVLFGSKTAL
ncbi:Methylated-DNA--protein-cysteine methyltransferase [hydrothermal vent metagenome]|uniref:methylated-DNA--[protein]-cysteine S-methyltransferase n=1 Tax=hydrothermal vent metagenome TaxID=652676 RepID=A0A3B0WGD5_9ZZZZ